MVKGSLCSCNAWGLFESARKAAGHHAGDTPTVFLVRHNVRTPGVAVLPLNTLEATCVLHCLCNPYGRMRGLWNTLSVHRHYDVQGAGMTPYSRRADGRAVMRSSLRGAPVQAL